MRFHALSRSAALWLGAALAVPTALHAQDPDEVAGTDVGAVVIHPEPPFTGYAPDVPMPPKVLLGRLSGHDEPPIPEGPFRAAPNTPEAEVVDPAIVDTGNFRYFQNESVTPSGASRSIVGEPSVAQTDNVAFETGNWYGARSLDQGSSWTHVSPYTFFPSADGGFCCDQRIVYVPSHDITIWVLQYSRNSNGRGGYRIAVANGDADLANPNSSAWTTYYIRPSSFGFTSTDWFDFPDIAASNTGFFLSANVYNNTPSYQGTAILRFRLAQLQANGTISINYINSTTHGVGFSPRMAKGGTGDRIFWACLNSSSSLQIGYYTESGTYSRVNRSVSSVNTGNLSSTPAPDGVNWARRAPTRFRGAYGNSSEVGFIFTSGPISGRAQPFLRVFRFTADSSRSLISQQDIWNSSYAFAYGAAATNRQGHVGLVLAGGSSSTYVTSYATIVDNYQPWGGLTIYSMGAGQDSPNQNRWGDYFDVREHDNYTDTFVATGMRQVGGSSNSNNEPHFLWFGRDDYEPTWVNLSVQSTGVSGVPITLDETDMSGRKNGSTTFTRRFTPRQPYTLTAPSTRTSGSTVYVFERWRYQVQPGASFNNRPIGDRVLSLSSIGNLDDVCIADYKIRRTLSIQSSNPSSGVSISVTPDDINGNSNGSTTFTRYYRNGETVSLTAPSSVGFNPFRHWLVNGSVQTTSRTLNVVMSGARTAVAVYWNNIAGSVQSIGAGCVGSNGRVPSHSISWPAGQQGPQQGTRTTYSLAGARALTGCALNVGLSNRIFNGLRLPLDLGIIGVTGCTLYHDIVSSQSLATDASGRAAFPIAWPVDPSSIGVPIFSSWTIIDPGVRRPLPLTLSNAMETRVGGNR